METLCRRDTEPGGGNNPWYGTSCRAFLVYDIVIIRLISARGKLISLEVEGAKDLAALSD